jgi:hypothetical protein
MSKVEGGASGGQAAVKDAPSDIIGGRDGRIEENTWDDPLVRTTTLETG